MGEQPVENKTKDELIVILKHLLKEIEIPEEENKSLWFMLDEIHESDKAAKSLTDEQREKAMFDLLSQIQTVGDA